MWTLQIEPYGEANKVHVTRVCVLLGRETLTLHLCGSAPRRVKDVIGDGNKI
jgi:hypothetical protein